jgi:hypothetical protein
VKSFGVSWNRAEYHGSLIHLGKTELNTTEEIDLLSTRQQTNIRKKGITFARSPNPVFLYEVNQLRQEKDDINNNNNNNNNNLDVFVQGFTNFLGLDQKLPPPVHEKPGMKLDAKVQAERDALKLDICLKKYKNQREILLEIGQRAADWIIHYFMNVPDVYVANPDQFRRLVETYGKDPCEGREPTNTTNATTVNV